LAKHNFGGNAPRGYGPGLSCILQIEPTWTPCECWQRHRWTKLFGWNAMHCV